MKKEGQKRNFWCKFFAWGFFAAACIGYGVIMYEAAQNGTTSSEHSGAVGDMIPDSVVDDAYDSNNLIDIKDFSVSLSPEKEKYSIGDVISYTYSYEPTNTSYKDISVAYNPESSVSLENGKITCLEEGTTTFTFSSSKNTKLVKTVSIEIEPVKGTGVEIGSDLEMIIGDVRTLSPIISPENATDKRVSFSSSNEAVASVSNAGIIKALSEGETTITASLISDPTISDNIKVKVSAESSKTVSVISLSLPETESCYAKETKLITGSFLPKATSDFDLSKLVVTSSDSKLIVTKKSSSVANGSFVLSVKYNDDTITEEKNITINASYDGASPLTASCVLTVKPTISLTTSMVSASQKTSYSGSIVSFTNYASENMFNSLTLSVNYSESDVSSHPAAYKTSDVKWEVPPSLVLVSSNYKRAIIKPANTDCAIDDAEIYFYPNKDAADRITYTVSYSLTSDNSKITAIDSELIDDGSELSPDTLFEGKIDASLTLSEQTENSSILSSSGFEAEIVEGGSLAALSRSSESGAYSLETGSEEGNITIRLSSILDAEITKDIHISLARKYEKCELEYNGENDCSSITMQKGEVALLKFLTGMSNTFKDGTYLDKYWYDDNFDVSFYKDGLLSYNKSSYQLLAYGDAHKEPVSLTFTSQTDCSLSSSLEIIIDYTAPTQSGFTLNFTLIEYPGEGDYNKPTSLNKIAVGTKLRAIGKIDQNASIQTGFYLSSDQEVITIDEITGELTAVSKGVADVEFHSTDNPELFIKQTITVVNSTGPIYIDKDTLGAMEYSLYKTDDGIEYAHCKLAFGQSYSLRILKPAYATSMKVTYRQAAFNGKEANSEVLSINTDGIITLKSIGTSYIHITYGDSDSLNKTTYVLEVETTRDIGSFWSTFLYKVRKLLGHFGVFMLCAMCTMAFAAIYFKKEWQQAIGIFGSLYVGFTFASLSELVQKFTPGRYGCWSDIWIDFKGTMLGTAIVAGIALIVYLIKLLYRHLLKEGKIKKKEKHEKK